ncbi:opsin-2-like, partial [Amphibalanus amphitrite]
MTSPSPSSSTSDEAVMIEETNVCGGPSLSLPSETNISSLLLDHGYDVQGWKRLGLCSDNYLQYIQPVWASFDAPPYSHHLVIAGFHLFMMLVGCSGNLFVIVVFIRNRKLRKPSNLLLLNLAISDFVMVLKSFTIIINSVFGGPVLGVI